MDKADLLNLIAFFAGAACAFALFVIIDVMNGCRYESPYKLMLEKIRAKLNPKKLGNKSKLTDILQASVDEFKADERLKAMRFKADMNPIYVRQNRGGE